MEIFKLIEELGHEKIIFTKINQVRVILAIHNTTLGPATGGTRILDYKNEEDALYDVTRLSYGMTLKNSAANLLLGGGKAVVIGDAKKIKTEEFFKAYGKFLNSLGGIYYTAEDMNMTTADIDMLSKYTKYVAGTSAVSSAPAPYTAKGVYNGLMAGVKHKFNLTSIKGKTVAVQGLGNVGYRLCKILHDEGALLKVFDISQEKMDMAKKEFNAEIVSADEIVTTKCDIFAPCALGAVINENNIDQLKCEIIAGSANNVLDNEKTGEKIFQKGIIYVPDYIINAGGVINCGMEVMGTYNSKTVGDKVEEIYCTVEKILNLSVEQNQPTNIIADKLALDIINNSKKNRIN